MIRYRPVSIVDGLPCYEKPYDQIVKEVMSELLSCPMYGAFECEAKTAAKYVSEQQRKWYKGVCLPWLTNHEVINKNQESRFWWDDEVKRQCRGLDLLRQDVFFTQGLGGAKIPTGRLTITGVSVTNMRAFITEILAKSVDNNWGIAKPDKELSEKLKAKRPE